MALQLNIFLILTGLTGVYSITTVTKVSVKAGDSISIPCLYNQEYINHVKYLCKGYFYSSCSYEVGTDQQSLGRFLISDDKNLKIFTVTIKDVTDGDTDFWCAVEIKNGRDVATHFQLSVTRGVSSLYVDHQEVTGFVREQVTITCYCQNSGEAKWCRVGGPCVGGTQRSLDGTTAVLDRSQSSGLRVTMSGLKMEDSGWYCCVEGDLQMPVHLSVRERPTTAVRPVPPTSTKPVTSMTDTEQQSTTDEDPQDSLSGSFMPLVISFCLLTFIVILSLFIWFCIKRQKQIQEQSSDDLLAENEVMYSEVMKKRESSGQPICTETEVTYTSVKTPQQKGRPRPRCSENEVSYSSVKIPQRDKAREVTDIYSNLTYNRKC